MRWSVLLTLPLWLGAACGSPTPGEAPDWKPSPSGKRDSQWPDRVQRVEGWRSQRTGATYGVTIYYPPSYGEARDARYPVVYMQDGQNLFVDELAATGISWDVAGAMDEGAANGSIPEALIVAVDSADRTWDYTPVADPEEGAGGGADAYLAFLVEELKPVVDDRLRTLPDRLHTGIVGSSLGGILSLWAGSARAGSFGLIGAMSPATWWADEWITSHVNYTAPWRIYLDSGDSGPVDDDVALTTNLAAGFEAAAAAGEGVNVLHVVQPGAEHGEAWWRERFPVAMRFLLDPS